jgi:uncharacterized protein DUF4238
MSLDHYISQVHLRNFYSPVLEKRMYAIRKSDMKAFETRANDVCRIEEGSTNAYLRQDRAVEEFLLRVEPHYNRSIELLRHNACDTEAIFAIAGFVAYVLACSPASMRVFSDPLRASVLSTADLLDQNGEPPASSEALGGQTLSELLAANKLILNIDPKFPQALSINSILNWTSIFGNSPWEILTNQQNGGNFFTSDFPIGFELGDDPRIVNKIVPLAPDLAIRVRPDIGLSGAPLDLHFKGFRARRRILNHQELIEINRLLVRCAEDLVFYKNDESGIRGFISKNRFFRIEGITQRIPVGTGFLNVSSQRVVSTKCR